MTKKADLKVFVELEYNDESSFSFDMVVHADSLSKFKSIVMMVARGSLMASNAKKVTAYNMEGFPIASYIK